MPPRSSRSRRHHRPDGPSARRVLSRSGFPEAFVPDRRLVHLLTKEAFAVYARHLATNGIIAVHVSNTSLNLEPVVVNLARQYHYKLAAVDNPGTEGEWWVYSSQWILLTRNEAFIRSPMIRAATRPEEAKEPKVPLWTDYFASLFQILRWNWSPTAEPGAGAAQVELAESLFQQGDFAGAVARYRLALQSDPGLVRALNNLAWILATSPEAALRDGPEAVRLAEGACRLTQYKQTILVGTLAAAYAEAGRFLEAVTTAEMACTLATQAGDQALLARNQQLLELYRARQPYHEPSPRTHGASIIVRPTFNNCPTEAHRVLDVGCFPSVVALRSCGILPVCHIVL